MSNSTDLWQQPSSTAAPQEEDVQAPAGDQGPGAGEQLSPAPAAPQGRAAEDRPASPEGPPKSKSQRVREFLEQHPKTRNRDVAEALGQYGVTAADVANVKSQMRRKAQQAAAPRAASPPPAPRPAISSKRPPAPRGADEEALAIEDIEAGVALIERLGGFERARHVMDLIQRIRQIES